MPNENETTSLSTTSTPTTDEMPIEPTKLVIVWREAAATFLKHGEATAADAFLGCSRMLGAWIEHEGPSVILCMPRSMLRLINAAMHFNQHDRDSWHALAQAAVDCQTGPS